MRVSAGDIDPRIQAHSSTRRTVYSDLGLAFAKDWGHLHGREDSLGLPLQANNLGQREFARVIKAAGVRPIPCTGSDTPQPRRC